MTSFKDHLLDSDKLKSGVKMPLFNRDGGISKDYIMVRWTWADEVRAALDNLKRDGMKRIVQITPTMNVKDKKAAQKKNRQIESDLVLDGIASQVAGWSFDEKPTKANVKAFLKSRPDQADRIDTLAANTKVFFTDSGESS